MKRSAGSPLDRDGPRRKVQRTEPRKIQVSTLTFASRELESPPSIDMYDETYPVELVFEQNKLIDLPYLSRFSKCIALNINLNFFRKLPDISGLHLLEDLRAASCQIEDVSALKDCSSRELCSLALSFNKIREFDGMAGHFPKLEFIFLDNNRLERFPLDILNLKRLNHLALSFNRLTHVPDLSGLKCLQELYLDHNDLDEFPPSLADMPGLIHVSFSYNAISDVKGDLSKMVGLRELYLDNNCLRHVPSGVTKLKNIVHISFSFNRIARVDGIGQLTSLQELYLDNNLLCDLPPEVSMLRNLKTLSLVGNSRMHSLPGDLLPLHLNRLFFDRDTHFSSDYLYHAMRHTIPLPPRAVEIPSLLQLAANTVLSHNMTLPDGLPTELLDLLYRDPHICTGCRTPFVSNPIPYQVTSQSFFVRNIMGRGRNLPIVDRHNRGTMVPVSLRMCADCDNAWRALPAPRDRRRRAR